LSLTLYPATGHMRASDSSVSLDEARAPRHNFRLAAVEARRERLSFSRVLFCSRRPGSSAADRGRRDRNGARESCRRFFPRTIRTVTANEYCYPAASCLGNFPSFLPSFLLYPGHCHYRIFFTSAYPWQERRSQRQ